MEGSTHLFSKTSLWGQVKKSKLSVNEQYIAYLEKYSTINWWSFSSRPPSNISYMLKISKKFFATYTSSFFCFIWFWFQFQLRVNQHKQQPYFCLSLGQCNPSGKIPGIRSNATLIEIFSAIAIWIRCDIA